MKNLKIVIEVDKKTGAIKAVEKEFTQLDGTVRKTSKTIDSTTRQLAKFAAGFVGFSAAINTVRDAFDTFRELDTLIGDIAKTTGLDRTSQQLGDLVGQLDRLATSKAGFVVQDLYEIAAGAGQLGIAKKDIVKFTETVEKLKMTTDLTAEEASRDFARISHVLKEPISDIDRLGSVFNELSNTTTATVRDLLYFTQRIGSNAKQFGMTTAEIVGLSAAMKDMSINFEVGGSAFSRTIAQMQAKSKTFANEMRVDADQFAQMMKEKPMEALDLFLQKLHELEGGEKYDFLKKLGLGGTETATVLLNISNNLELVHKNIAIANAEYQKGTSLEKEYQQASKSVDSALATLNSTIDVFEKQMLMKFKEPIVDSVGELSELIKYISGAGDKIDGFAQKALIFGEIVGPITAATAATKLFNLALKANPLIMAGTTVAAGIAAVVGYLKDYNAEIAKIEAGFDKAKEREAAGLDAYGNKPVNVDITQQEALGNAYVSIYQSDLDEETKQKQLLAIKEQILETTQKTAEEQAKNTNETKKTVETTGEVEKNIKSVTAATKEQKKVDEEWAAAIAYTKSVTGDMFKEVVNNIDFEEEKVQQRYDTEQQLIYATTDIKAQTHQNTMNWIDQEIAAMTAAEKAAEDAARAAREAAYAPNFAGMSLGSSSTASIGDFGSNRALSSFGYTADGIGSILDKFQSPDFQKGLKIIGGWLFGKTKVVDSGVDVGENLSNMRYYEDKEKSGLFTHKSWTDYENFSAYEEQRVRDMFDEYDFLLDQLDAAGDMFLDAGRYSSIDKALGQNFMDAVGAKTYSVWEEYAKGMSDSTEELSESELAQQTNEAIFESLKNYVSFYRDFETWLIERENGSSAKYAAEYLQKDLESLEQQLGATDVNVANFLDKFEDVKDNLEPGELEKWERLGDLLMQATDAADAYAKEQEEILKHNLEYEQAYKDSLIEQQEEMQAALQDTVRDIYDFTNSLRDIADSSRSVRDTIANIGLSDNQSLTYYIQKVNETEEQFMSYFDSSGHLLDGKFDEMKATYDIQKSYLQTVANSADILGDQEGYLKENMLDLLDKNDMLLNANAKAMEVEVIGGTLSIEDFATLIELNEEQKQQLITTANNLTVIKGSSAETVAQLSSQYNLTDEQKAEIAEMAADNKITVSEISEMKTATVEQKERIFGISSADSLTVGEMDALVAANESLYKGEPVDVSNITQAQISGYAKDTTVNTLYKGDPVSVSNMIPAVETGLAKNTTVGTLYKGDPVSVSNINDAQTDVSSLAKDDTVETLYKGQPITANNSAFVNLLDIKENTQPLTTGVEVDNSYFPYISNLVTLTDEQKGKLVELTGQNELLTEKVSTDDTLTYVEKWSRLLYEKQIADDLHNSTPLGAYSFEATDNYATLGTQEKIDFSNLTGTAVDSAAAEDLYNFAKGFSETNDDLGYFKTELGATLTGITNTTKLNAYNALFDVLQTDARDAGVEYAQWVKSEYQKYKDVEDYISASTYWDIDGGKIVMSDYFLGLDTFTHDQGVIADAEADTIRQKLVSFGYPNPANEYDQNPNILFADNGNPSGVISGLDITSFLTTESSILANKNAISNMKFFANGGILEHGVYSEPTIAVFAEAGQREAFVPLPDGRNIPVKIQNDTTAQETRALRQQMEELIQLNRKLLRTIQEWDEHGLKTQEIAS